MIAMFSGGFSAGFFIQLEVALKDHSGSNYRWHSMILAHISHWSSLWICGMWYHVSASRAVGLWSSVSVYNTEIVERQTAVALSNVFGAV